MVSFDSKTTGVEVNGRREGWYVSLLIYGWPSVVEDYFLFIMLGVKVRRNVTRILIYFLVEFIQKIYK